jgi:hypothetical protein
VTVVALAMLAWLATSCAIGCWVYRMCRTSMFEVSRKQAAKDGLTAAVIWLPLAIRIGWEACKWRS